MIKPVNVEALSKWVGQFPDDVISGMGKIAPMLQQLGYDPYANPPDYGKSDTNVADNTRHIKQNLNYWKKREAEILKQEKQQRRQKQHNDIGQRWSK